MRLAVTSVEGEIEVWLPENRGGYGEGGGCI